MLLFKLSPYVALIAALTVPSALGGPNIEETVSNIQTLGNGIDNAQRVIENYNGGLLGALSVANAIYKAHMSAEDARKQLGNSDPLTEEDSQKAGEAYLDIHPRLLEAMKAGTDKAPDLKKAGVGYIARGMMSNLYQEKNSFDDVMRDKLSSKHYEARFGEEIDREYEKAVKAFQD